MSVSSRTNAHWPPFLTTRRAIAYTGLSRATINRAVSAGLLQIHGRPGGGERIFRREDIDRWLASGGAGDPSSSARGPGRGPAVGIAVALDRINRIARGGR